MLNQFLQFVKKHALINNGEKLLLAVSGGLDSMVLLNLCKLANYNVTVAHCNFQLRGQASDGDAAFVKKISADLGFQYFDKRFDTKLYAISEGISTQMAARNLRYQWFNELIKVHKLDKIVIAHHLNDNLETVLLNLVRGTSISGLRGMKSKMGNVIRPLLDFERSDIEAYAKSEGIEWREDSSNASDDYKRNFLRHQVVPKLSELNPSLLETFKNTIEKNAEVESVFHNRIEWLKSILKIKGSFAEIDKEDLKSNQVGVFQLSEILKEFGFNYEQSKEILEVIEGMPGKQFLTSTHQLVIDRTSLVIAPLSSNAFEQFQIIDGQTLFSLSGSEYLIERLTDSHSLQRNAAIAELDYSKLRFPLVIRAYSEGDYFYPLGMKGKKKLSDFMIDEKIPLNLKQDIRVVVSNNEIVWIVGRRIDDRFKVTAKTKQVLRIKQNV
jgi:tRNA(Ile)-lysidine synthase